MSAEPSGGFLASCRSYRGTWFSVSVVLAMIATLLILTYQTNGGNILGALPQMLDGAISSPVSEGPKACRTTCVKAPNGKLFDFSEFHEPREYPIPQCSPSQDGGGPPTVLGSMAAQGVCSTWCTRGKRGGSTLPLSSSPATSPSSTGTVSSPSAKNTANTINTKGASRLETSTEAATDDGETVLTELSGSYSEIHSVAQCPLPLIAMRPMPQEGTQHVWNRDAQRFDRWENMAQHCNDIHGLDRNLGQEFDGKTLHIVYFTWLTQDQNLRRIIPPQMKDVIESGLFDRPNTKLYMIVSAESDEEFRWFMDQDWVKKYKPEVLRTKRNQYEYAGIRFLWELACKHNDDLFLYFHSKGARYGRGRIGMEVILTREVVVNWRLNLNLLAAHSGSQSMGLGGPGFQWMNFFWVRGDIALTTPKPAPVTDRYYYENWMGLDLRYGKRREVSDLSVSQCSQASGMEAALREPIVPEPSTPRRTRPPQYGILRCTQSFLGSGQLSQWSAPAEQRMDQFLALLARIRQMSK